MTFETPRGAAHRSSRGIARTFMVLLAVIVVFTSCMTVIAVQSASNDHTTVNHATSSESSTVAGYLSNSTSTSSASTTIEFTTTSSGSSDGATFVIRVVNATTNSSAAGVSVVAGPASSPQDVALTPGGPTLGECVHQVPNGSTVSNGTVVSNGTTSTFAPCGLKTYTTNSSGLVSITGAVGSFYFIKAGDINDWIYVVVGVENHTVMAMTIPLPSGNVTVPTGESCPNVDQSNATICSPSPGYTIYEPPTTILWPCGAGLPNGSTVAPQGPAGNLYIAYTFATFQNGTKAALQGGCDVANL